MCPYQYRPLRNPTHEIRLVYLLPGTFADPLNIRIVHSSFPTLPAPPVRAQNAQVNALRDLVSQPWTVDELENGEVILFNVATGETHPVPTETPPVVEPPGHEFQFEALSYVWGDSDVSQYARVEVENSDDDRGSQQSLGVRANLAAALYNLRYLHDTRVLWIDALCINQADITERNEQVKRMSEIYRAARRVVAWLGEESSNSAHALTTFRHVGSQVESTISGRIIAATNATETRLWRNDNAPCFDHHTWQALFCFVERPWFYRLWCWQEIKLGGSQTILQCGKDEISWYEFWKAILCLHNKDVSPSNVFRERCRHIAFLRHDSSSHPFCNILDVSRSKGCADPRDKIYGLLGLTPTYFSSHVNVDYTRSAESVYKEAFFAHLQATERLELLKHCDIASRRTGGPTWVPDWSITEFAAPILSEQLSSGVSRAWTTFSSKDPSVLQVVGKEFAVIKLTSEAASKDEEETLRAVRDWQRCLPTQSRYVSGESIRVAFALTLCMNRTKERHPYNHFLGVHEWVGMVRRILKSSSGPRDDQLYESREIANLIQKVRGRKFFTTESGYIGTAPSGVEGALLLGTYSPTVLRKTASGLFQVVGECYVHGLENATGLVGELPKGWTTIIKGDSHGRPTQRFINVTTGQETYDDPRLGPLPRSWDREVYQRLENDAAIFERFRNTESGELINHDPRLSPSALQARGIDLQTFQLV
ncbi:hypothetical protein CDD83_9787 [Cordyceps sp. RAO-2017]|nr:hypothetical protein CDD83_9787 [Cordyceps sp. RAO-2017]